MQCYRILSPFDRVTFFIPQVRGNIVLPIFYFSITVPWYNEWYISAETLNALTFSRIYTFSHTFFVFVPRCAARCWITLYVSRFPRTNYREIDLSLSRRSILSAAAFRHCKQTTVIFLIFFPHCPDRRFDRRAIESHEYTCICAFFFPKNAFSLHCVRRRRTSRYVTLPYPPQTRVPSFAIFCTGHARENPLGPCRASQGRRGSGLKPRYVTRSICGRVTGPPRVIRLRDPSRARALQSENATIGVRESIYANGNRLISDAFRRNFIRHASATILLLFSLFFFRLVPPLSPLVPSPVAVKALYSVSAANWQSVINFTQIARELSNLHKFTRFNWMSYSGL